ncbi:MAG: YigZ family protein, partial [Flavobacteriaceae bacterium]|nr:YigZ family protein [Flavobacteriaceae bacterium]
LQFEYVHMNKVMRLVKDLRIHIVHQLMEMDCKFEISIRKKDAVKVKKAFEDLRCVIIKQIV